MESHEEVMLVDREGLREGGELKDKPEDTLKEEIDQMANHWTLN